MKFTPESALVTVAEMGEADRLTIDGGTPGIALMENAGRGAARVIQRRYAAVPAVVLCGPGNNGGDGFVIARELRDHGWPVRLGLLGEVSRLSGDAALAAASWDGPVDAMSPDLLDGAGLVVDAIFGAGLSRDLDGVARAVVERVAGLGVPVIAVDVPSGLDGDTGRVRGAVAPADVTVTFFRKKPAHLLLPGRPLCGAVRVIDIGIDAAVLERIGPRQAVNCPDLWRGSLARPSAEDHKYRRGHAVIAGGGALTGAARLAADAARRVGAGLLGVACPGSAAQVYRAALPGALVAECDRAADFAELIADERKNALLVGPGHGVDDRTRGFVEAALATGRSVVLDADALTVFADDAEALARMVKGPLVITPHDGEFARLFSDLKDEPKPDRARRAAERLGGVVVCKGADTVIAGPDGTMLVNDNAPPWLATGGTGDVLAGSIVGLLAQGMPALDAAAAAVWINGAAATQAGPGMLAEDLPAHLSDVVGKLKH